MGLDIDKEDNELNETLYVGHSCKADVICNSHQTLIELEFKVNAEAKCFNSDSNNFTYSSAIGNVDFGFWLKDQDIDSYSSDDYYVWSGGEYKDFEVDTTYSLLASIPNDRCAQLYVKDDIPGTYKVYQDGVEMMQSVAQTEEDSTDKGTVTTDLGEVSLCSSAFCRNCT